MPKKTGSKKGSSRSSGGSKTVTATIPKSLTGTIDKIRAKLDTMDSQMRDFVKEFRTQAKAWSKMSERNAASGAKRAKRKPSEYNLFLKDKMKQGMSMTEAVQAWKADRGGSSSSMSSGSSTSSSMGGESESDTEDEA